MKIVVDVTDGKANVAIEGVDLTLTEARNASGEFLRGLLSLGQQWMVTAMAPPESPAASEPKP